ncbi:MAG: hypothetical protein FJZ11_02125 [Candidatus Omnitrophica bacterium]|nr:hypothetical protein [Candidatus Omnitrophota bacterium]
MFIVFLGNRKTKKALGKLANYLPGALSKSPFDASYKGNYQGLNFSVSLISGEKNRLKGLYINIYKSSFLNLVIYNEKSKEKSLTIFSERIGRIQEVKTNDETFDREFFILSNDAQKAMNYLNNSARKQIITELFTEGFDAIAIDSKKLSLQKRKYDLSKDFDPQRMNGALQRLNALASGI